MQEDLVQRPGCAVRQYTIMLQNRVGALSSLLGLLDSRGIFCLGFSVNDYHEATIARLIVSDPERVAETFLERGIGYTETEVLVTGLRSGLSDLKRCLDALYAAEVNVDYVYSLHPRRMGEHLIALHIDDILFGRHILNATGFPILYQEDLSR